MTNKLRVLLEVGAKGRRVVAAATDWPGLDRWGTTEDDAVAKLSSYLPRYTGVAGLAGLADAFARQRTIGVVERYSGSSSTDFWGIAHVPSQIEREVLSAADLERRLDLLRACWAYFDDVAGRVSTERPQPRGGGRNRDSIIRHTYGTEPANWSRKVGVRTELDVVLTPKGLATHRREPRPSSSSCAAPLTTSWITRGRWRTGTSHPEDPPISCCPFNGAARFGATPLATAAG